MSYSILYRSLSILILATFGASVINLNMAYASIVKNEAKYLNQTETHSDTKHHVYAHLNSQQQLNQYYKTDNHTQSRCYGQWVYPKKTTKDNLTPDNITHTDDNDIDISKETFDLQKTLKASADYGYYDSQNYAELIGNVQIQQNHNNIQADSVKLDLKTGQLTADGQVLLINHNQYDTHHDHTNTTDNQIDNSSHSKNTTKGGFISLAQNLSYNTQTEQSTAQQVAFASIDLQAHGYAEKLESPDTNHYKLQKVTFSTCPPNTQSDNSQANTKPSQITNIPHKNQIKQKGLTWQLDAKNIDLNMQTGRGEAKETTLRIANIPVFYLPYFNFPIDSRRASGFLLPQGGFDSENGVDLNIPYYFNLAPNYDATLNTHLYSQRNPMLSAEFRYLTEDYGSGELITSLLPKDKKYNHRNRSSIFFNHYWLSKDVEHLTSSIKYNYVSDPNYLNDFDSFGLAKNEVNLPRYIKMNYYNNYLNTEAKVETYQTLKSFTDTGVVTQDKDKPYARLPQVSLNYQLPISDQILTSFFPKYQPYLPTWLDGLKITGIHDMAYFKKSIHDNSEAEKSGFRLFNNVNASYTWQKPWGYATPSIGIQHLFTAYDQASLDDQNLSKKEGNQWLIIPEFSLDTGLNFYQKGAPFSRHDNLEGYQLLSPRLKYTYIPYHNQDALPNFNTHIASTNYEQLFTNTWFLGHDRVQDLHALTPAINYRYIDKMGKTRFNASLAEQLYLNRSKVGLSSNDPLFHDKTSGLVWQTSIQPYYNLWVDINGALKPNYDINYFTTQLRYQPNKNSLINFGIIERKNNPNINQLPLSALTASVILPIQNNWRVLAQGQYDHKQQKISDALLGIDYEDCCFGFAIYGRHYYNELNPKQKPSQAIMAEIRLNGLGSTDGRLARLMSNKVFGFAPIQQQWKK